MSSSSYDTSSDDEDDYCNAAARLKALKSQCNNKSKAPAVVNSDCNSGSQERQLRSQKSCSVPKSSTPPQEISSDEDVECESDSSAFRETLEPKEFNENSIYIEDSPIEIPDSPEHKKNGGDNNKSQNDESFSEISTVDVYIRWKSNNIECHQINKHEPLLRIFQYFADQENIPVNRVLVTRKDAPIKPTDTPASLRLSIIDVLEAGIISADAAVTQETEEEEDDPNVCKIKAQISSKKSLTFNLKKQEPFEILAEYCAKELEVPLEKLKLYFDGEHIGEEETPEDLDLDDEACIDIKVIQ